MVTKVEETIIKDDQTSIELSSNQYPDVIHPNGYQWITSFERKPFPTTTFQGDGFKLMKTVFMVHGSNTTVIMYQNKGRESITLALNPLFVLRDYHSLFHEHDHFDFYREEDGKVSVIYPLYGAKPLYLECTKGTFHARLQHHFYNEDGIHCVSEIFDGLDPHVGRGCMQQAWSVGMLLMVFDRLKYMGGQKTKVKGRRTRLAEEV